MAIAFGNKAQQATVTAGINRVLGKPQVAPQATPQPLGASIKSPLMQPKPVVKPLTQNAPPLPPPVVPVEVPMQVDMKQFQNPLVDLATQGNFTEFVQFEKDVKTPAGVIAYYMAYLPPSQMSNSEDPVLSVQYMFSNGEVRKRSRWFALKTDPKSNLSKFWGSYIPNWQMLQYDEALFSTGFDIIVKDVFKNGMQTKYSDIKEVYLNPNIDVSSLSYDLEYVPCQYVQAWSEKQPCCLCVVKGNDGQIHRYEFEEMCTIEQAEAMKKLRKEHEEETTE